MIGRPVPSSVLYSTTFTLPRGAGAAGFAATATATLPSGRGRDVTAGAAEDAGFGEVASAGFAVFVVACGAGDLVSGFAAGATGALLVAGFAAGFLTAATRT